MDNQAYGYQMDEIIEDTTFAPLRRNHACLQCKKRKIKCDAVKPACSPCLRSHAHAIRSANRSGNAPPPITCSYADIDDDCNDTPERAMQSQTGMDGGRRNSNENTSQMHRKAGHPKKIQTSLEKERRIRDAEEKETLLAKIAELESRISKLAAGTIQTETAPIQNRRNSTSRPDKINETSFFLPESVTAKPPDPNILSIGHLPNANPEPFKFENLFLVPMNWPKNLPAPFLLEHLVETFFHCCSQLARTMHRSTLLTRIKLPPNHPHFPAPALLHAICAMAALHTAWVPAVAPEALDDTISKAKAIGISLENFEDFAIAQAECAHKASRYGVITYGLTTGETLFEFLQTDLLLGELYTIKGLTVMGWMHSGAAAQLIHAVEINVRKRAAGFKPPLLAVADDPRVREERLATVWYAFLVDTVAAVNDMHCRFPTSISEFRKADTYDILENPQHPDDPDVYTYHPVPDSFVLVCKAALLNSRCGHWKKMWAQEDPVPADHDDAHKRPDFRALVNDIKTFQASLPPVLKNAFRQAHSAGTESLLDADFLLIHIMPNIALAVLFEPFINWDSIECEAIMEIKRAYEATVAILHLIPSNLDVTLVLSPLMIISLFTTARMIIDFIHHALDQGAFGLALQYQNDLTAVQDIFQRYGAKFGLGLFMNGFLTGYLNAYGGDKAVVLRDVCKKTTLKDADAEYLEIATMLNLPNPSPPVDISRSQSNVASTGRSGSLSTGLSPVYGSSSGEPSEKATPESVQSLNDTSTLNNLGHFKNRSGMGNYGIMQINETQTQTLRDFSPVSDQANRWTDMQPDRNQPGVTYSRNGQQMSQGVQGVHTWGFNAPVAMHTASVGEFQERMIADEEDRWNLGGAGILPPKSFVGGPGPIQSGRQNGRQ